MNLTDYVWNLGDYALPMLPDGAVTMADATHCWHLSPKLRPEDDVESDVEFIRRAQKMREIKHVFFCLSKYEARLNWMIAFFCIARKITASPDDFLEMKSVCVETVLSLFTQFDPNQGTSFLTYLQKPLTASLLRLQMNREAWSFSSLTEYARARQMNAIYDECQANQAEAVQRICAKYGCTVSTAQVHLDAARRLRNRQQPRQMDEDGNMQTLEEMIPDHWDYVSILQYSIEAETMEKAFSRLSYREQTLLEKRNAICMTCGRVSDLRTRASFDELAILFEGSGRSGAERAYNRAIEKLTLELTKLGVLHCVRYRQTAVQREGKNNTAATYEYLVDGDGEWGEIQFDFVEHAVEVVTFSKRDTPNGAGWAVEDAVIADVWASERAGKLAKKGFRAVGNEAK